MNEHHYCDEACPADCQKPKSALRVGQPVQLTGIVLRRYDDEFWEVQVEQGSTSGLVRGSALTPVFEPEPQWTPGDLVRVDNLTYFFTDLPGCSPAAVPYWCCANRTHQVIYPKRLSELWAQGLVTVLHKEPSDG